MFYTLQIYTVCKSRVEISRKFMEIFLILKRLGGQFDPSRSFFKNVSAKEIVNCWFLWLLATSFLKISLKFRKSLRRYGDYHRQFEKNFRKTTLEKPNLIRVKYHGLYRSLLQRNFISFSLRKTFTQPVS